MTRKTVVKSTEVTNTTDEAAGQPLENEPEAEPDGSGIFEDLIAEKPERLSLETLLPFLKERIAFDMPSDLKYLDSVLDYLNERLVKLGMVNPGDSEVLIALDEAIVNAIKHGNKCDPDRAVQIVAEFSRDGVRFTITDEGQGFSKDEVPDPTDPCRLLEPSGRGLLLINHIMDEVRHNNRGNEIQMYKRAPQSSDRGNK
ncbi:MAG TPA: ATP-binding protein [Blastocatellia bacterium]|nr:ATP-binding protein [Blastocatellia bacterium]